MASKKKGKATKNTTSSALSNKNASQPQKVIAAPVKNRKAGHATKSNSENSGISPAKPSEQTSDPQLQSVIWRRQKENNSSRGAASGGGKGGTGISGGGGTGSAEVRRFSLKISQFLKEVLTEFRKISWPERSQVIRETVSVLFLVLLITMLVWIFDLLVGKFVFSPLDHWGHLYGIGARN